MLTKKNWTCDWGRTGSSSFACAGGDENWISEDESTPSGEDWDVFTVDAGWCYWVRFDAPFVSWYKKYDMRDNSEDLNVKVEDFANANVLFQDTDRCTAS